MSEGINDSQLKAFEATLAGLRPSSVGLDRDQLMFKAGRLSKAGAIWVWPCATMAVGLLSLGLGMSLESRLVTSPVERVVYVPVEPKIEHSPAKHTESERLPQPALEKEDRVLTQHARLQDQVLRYGLEAFPKLTPLPQSEPPLTAGTLLDQSTTQKPKSSQWLDFSSFFSQGDRS